MKKSAKVMKLYSGVLAAAVTASTVGGVLLNATPVLADEGDEGIVTYAGDSARQYDITNGVVNVDQGNAKIVIHGNEGQELENKTFEVFKLFNAENSQFGESINYTFNPIYQHAVQTVVAGRLNELKGSNLTANQVTEYMVIDYIQMYLNNHEVEGAQTDQTLESNYSEFRYFVEDVRTQIKNEGLYGDIFTVRDADNTNSITIDGLAYGYYIVDETTQSDPDGNDWFASSLCMVDTANPTAEINIKSDYPSIIKKVQEDDYVTEGLGDDGYNDVGTYEIGQTVPFKYTSTIPDMNGYQKYYYAFHDSMDSGLSFHNNKDEIEITISNGKESYTLKDTEYNVYEEGKTGAEYLDEEDTFMIEIVDIKTIIDRNFRNISLPNPDGDQDTTEHHDYSNMTVTLTYNATLNESAKTGLPGNENDVRLEFSNDADINGWGDGTPDNPGDTGYTPWDTVVVFTFKMQGIKTNEHNNALEGAKFRLYSDPECTQEVYVKPHTGVATMSNEDLGISTMSVTSPDGTEEDLPAGSGEVVGVGANGYTVINRDYVGGDDHTGGTAPAGAVEMESDDNGNFTIYGLDEGTYYLKETDAPNGYRPLLDPIVIVVDATIESRDDYVAGTPDKALVALDATATIKEFYDGEFSTGTAELKTNLNGGTFDIEIVNEVGTKLPVTGSSAMLVMLGAGVALMGGAVLLSRKKTSR